MMLVRMLTLVMLVMFVMLVATPSPLSEQLASCLVSAPRAGITQDQSESLL